MPQFGRFIGPSETIKLIQRRCFFQVYDPKTDTWTFVAPMRHHGGGVGAGVIPNVVI